MKALRRIQVQQIFGIEKDGSIILVVKDMETGRFENWKAVKIGG